MATEFAQGEEKNSPCARTGGQEEHYDRGQEDAQEIQLNSFDIHEKNYFNF